MTTKIYNWKDIQKTRNRKTLKSVSDEKAIIQCFKKLLSLIGEIRAKKGNDSKLGAEETKLIKEALASLGEQQGYGVYTNKLPERDGEKFVNCEWIFDLHWVIEPPNTNYQIKKLPLVVECEWGFKRKGDEKNIPYGAMKYDFQKLLIANANLRLMIFELCKTDDFEHLNQYFEEAINNFEELKNGARFLIIAFYNDTFLYKIIKKRVKPAISYCHS